MNVLVVQNYDNTGLGQIERALDEAGAGVELIAAHRGDALPADHAGHDALVVLGGLPEAFPIFQWHDDTFTLPRGGTRLAGNAAAHNQAFRIRRAAYGIQFHFEADRALVERWNEDFAEFLAARQPQWRGVHAAEAARHGPAADAAGLTIARAWVAQIARVRQPAGAD